MRKKYKIVLLIILSLMIMITPAPQVANAQGSTLTVWLAVDDQIADEIISTLGASYDYVVGEEQDLVDDINRKNIIEEMPDIIIGLNDFIPDMAIRNLLQPVSTGSVGGIDIGLQRGSSFYKVESTGQVSASIVDGTVRLYGYPIAAQGSAIIVNTDKISTDATFGDIEAFENAIINSNDQSNPIQSERVYGLVTDMVKDATLWMYYGFGGRIFKNDVFDVEHLIVNEKKSINALGKLNDLFNTYQANPPLSVSDNSTAFELFTVDNQAAILLADFKTYKNITMETIKLYAAPSGTQLHSYTVMVANSGDSETSGAVDAAKTIAASLRKQELQNKFIDLGYIPVSKSLSSDSSASDEEKTYFSQTLSKALETPIEPLWNEVLDIFENQLIKVYERKVNAKEQIALGLETNIKILLPTDAAWGPLPDIGGGSDDNGLPFPIWLGVVSIVWLGLLKRRKW